MPGLQGHSVNTSCMNKWLAFPRLLETGCSALLWGLSVKMGLGHLRLWLTTSWLRAVTPSYTPTHTPGAGGTRAGRGVLVPPSGQASLGKIGGPWAPPEGLGPWVSVWGLHREADWAQGLALQNRSWLGTYQPCPGKTLNIQKKQEGSWDHGRQTRS